MSYRVLLNKKMKGLMLMAAGAALLCASHAWAYDGTVNITGNIVDGSCDIDTGSQNINVLLGNVQASSFSSTGSHSNPVPFNIILKNCTSSVSEAYIMFTGVPDTTDKTLLKLTQDTGVAQNVAVKIREPEFEQDGYAPVSIPLNMQLRTTKDGIKAGDNTLTYTLEYIATATPVTVGTGNAVMYFNLYYK